MTERGRQLILDLPHQPGQGVDDLMVAESNRRAVALIEGWPNWPAHCAILIGPAGSGKSHLAEIWRQRSGASVAGAQGLTRAQVLAVRENGAMVIEDLPGPDLDERALFHLINLAREKHGHLLLTARTHPQAWGIKLPDLASRLKATVAVEIGPPDDSLLRAVLVKLFADRQIVADEAIIAYLLNRMPRSFEAARQLVAEIDGRALEAKADITRTFVAKIVGELYASGPAEEG